MKVYKYRGGDKTILKRDLRSLANNQIYIASIDTLNDPFEAKVNIHDQSFELGTLLNLFASISYKKKVNKLDQQFFDLTRNFINDSKKWGIYSLSKIFNDELLWSYYANSHKGFCIEYDIKKLMEYKIPTELIIDVEYQNEMPTITLSDILNIKQEQIQKKLIGTKSKRWQHENEIRIVTGEHGLFEYDYRALKSIYFGCRSDEKFRKLTMRVLKGRGIEYYLMKPKEGLYELEAIKLDDLYWMAPKYYSSIASVEDGVPYIDDTLKPYEDLINKAIDIARQEPNCKKILDVYISSSRGTTENPVFYVTCERKDGLTKNIFLSKQEILDYGNSIDDE